MGPNFLTNYIKKGIERHTLKMVLKSHFTGQQTQISTITKVKVEGITDRHSTVRSLLKT